MKGKRWYILYGIALALLPVLLLIMAQLDSPSDLLAPPSLSGTYQEVQTAFRKSITDKSGIILQYPTSGDYRTSFVMKDIDGDNEDEALVFYILKSDETTVRINVLDKIDGQWKSLYDETGYGSNIISISFDDFNQDGKMEIITCWSLYETTASKILTIHEVEQNSGKPLELNTLVNQSYSFTSVADMDGDGYDEVLVTWLDDSDQNHPKSYASLLKQSKDGTISRIGQNVLLDASVSAYSSLKLETVEGRSIAFLDAYKGEDTMITEVIWWDEAQNALVAPLLDSESLTNLRTVRAPAVPSMDINNDDRIEIPIKVATSGEEHNKEAASVLYAWSVPSGDYLEPISYGFINMTVGCFFEIPDGYQSNILGYKISDDTTTTLYWTEDGVTRSEPLFTLVAKKAADIKDLDAHTFKVEHGGYVIYGSLTSLGETLGFTNELIENSFIFFDEIR